MADNKFFITCANHRPEKTMISDDHRIFHDAHHTNFNAARQGRITILVTDYSLHRYTFVTDTVTALKCSMPGIVSSFSHRSFTLPSANRRCSRSNDLCLRMKA